MFFLGAAFLLMETYAVNRLALLFGTTWIRVGRDHRVGARTRPRRDIWFPRSSRVFPSP
jgi:hypothetical protein